MYVKSAPSLISFVSIAILALSGAAAHGQAGSAPTANNQAQGSQAQPSGSASEHETDIGGSFYRAMNSTTTAGTVTQTPVDGYGGMFELRHIQKPLVGYELTYGYNSGTQTIGPSPACGLNCNTPAQTVSSGASLVGLDWIFSKQFGNLRPFAAAGVGFLIDEPSGRTAYGINDVTRIAWLYGGGVDYLFSSHLGVRAQYRAAVYKVPNLSQLFPAQGIYTQTREPMGGIFYRF